MIGAVSANGFSWRRPTPPKAGARIRLRAVFLDESNHTQIRCRFGFGGLVRLSWVILLVFVLALCASSYYGTTPIHLAPDSPHGIALKLTTSVGLLGILLLSLGGGAISSSIDKEFMLSLVMGTLDAELTETPSGEASTRRTLDVERHDSIPPQG